MLVPRAWESSDTQFSHPQNVTTWRLISLKLIRTEGIENVWARHARLAVKTLKGKIIRLAHMDYTDQFDVMAALSGFELVLLELGYTVLPGSGAANFCRSSELRLSVFFRRPV